MILDLTWSMHFSSLTKKRKFIIINYLQNLNDTNFILFFAIFLVLGICKPKESEKKETQTLTFKIKQIQNTKFEKRKHIRIYNKILWGTESFAS